MQGIPVVIRGARVSVGATRRVSAMSAVERFDFSFAPAYRSPARLFGIRPATAWVELKDERLEARFGPWRVSTPLSNVVDAVTTGPYEFLKTAGPARLAINDRGLDPLGVLRHPELTVTVREGDRLAARLNQRRTSRRS